ncbi:MAG: prenyltransferase/squalene oxidase repeat-containing protein [Anaerolineae bacterium]
MMRLKMSIGLRWLLVLVLVLTGISLRPGAALAAPATDAYSRMQAVERALNWLLTQQSADGSFSDSASTTIEVVFAARAANRNLGTWHAAGSASMLDYLASAAKSYTTDVGSTGKLLAAVTAANLNPHTFGGLDLVTTLNEQLANLKPGSETAIGQAWAILGLAGAGEPIPDALVSSLTTLQASDGGWEWGAGFGTDSNTSAIVLEALTAAGFPADNPAVAKGLAYLKSQITSKGGFTYSTAWGSDPDANSTEVSIQALLASGQDINSSAWQGNGISPLAMVMSWQLADGSFEWQAGLGANLLATAQAVPAMLGKTLPLKSAYTAARSALKALKTMQQPDGSFSGAFSGSLGPSTQVLLAIAAAGEDPAKWVSADGVSLLDFLRSQVTSISDAGVAGRLVTGLVLAKINPYTFSPQLVPYLKNSYVAETGLYDVNQNTWNQALAIWGLTSLGEQVPQPAVDWILKQQNADGGWGWAAAQTSDSNSTAVVLQALTALGYEASNTSVAKAVAYLRSQQAADGGFAYDTNFGSASDANSTAGALQALLSAGIDASDGFAWAKPGLTPMTPFDSLLALQTAGGAFEWQPGAGGDLISTVQAIPALLQSVIPERGAMRTVTSEPLTLSSSIVNTLPGSSAGAFNYYTLTAPENGQVTIVLSGLPGDPLAARGLGFAVYGPGGLVAQGADVNGVASVTIDTVGSQALTIQVYNYLPNLNLRYTLSVH